jgi:hypothetical protein
MSRRLSSIAVAAVLAMGLASNSGTTEQKLTRESLIGAWQHVSGINTRPDGTKFYPLGENATGLLIFDSAGGFSWQIIRPDIPKFGSNNRLNGTPEEYKAVAQGLLSFFGEYTVDDAGKVVIMRIVSSSFPNINNVEQKRAMTLSGDELTLVNQAGSSGGTAETKWKRVK